MKNKVLGILFMITIFSVMLVSVFLPDRDISISERRKLSSFPKLEIQTILNGDFFDDLNTYLIDQFPMRDLFINIKGIVANNIFQKKDEDNILVEDDGIYQLEVSVNEKSITHFTDLINNINKNYLKTDNVYYSIIPDKNYYLDSSIPKLDYDKLINQVNEKLSNMKYINIFDDLNLDSYYKTDIHWKQEELKGVLEELEKNMNLNKSVFPIEGKTYEKFYGVLYGRIANNLKPDNITYLTNEYINNATVFDYEKQTYKKVYEETDLKNIDSYDIYLGGAKSLLVIENKNQENNKELIIFRDSFGSSIAPLLISNYSRIILVDLRYIRSDLLGQIEELKLTNEKQDVLFLYSTSVINNSFTLK